MGDAGVRQWGPFSGQPPIPGRLIRLACGVVRAKAERERVVRAARPQGREPPAQTYQCVGNPWLELGVVVSRSRSRSICACM
jgi:hypothetical protein